MERYSYMHSPFKMLCIADLHDYDERQIEKIRQMEYDVCLLLGDIPHKALLEIKKANGDRPLYGVCGNHDDWDTLTRVGITDIHCKAVEVCGITIAGFSGSNRYKNGDYCMMTQKESIKAAKEIPPCDVLITHDSKYKYWIPPDDAHLGLKGISKYISKNKPQMHLFGHYHQRAVHKHKSTLSVCVYGIELQYFIER